ncbi:dihydroorotase family protein [Helicobacter pylori]|uniref:amidohydrolase family protein n=1 Tax=Helicobacter pylori TaxID=210 RepID=UPI001AA85C73|nr:dihydroorotase family protein [Helicobacter pylori]WRD86873.1 dihydroorotase family protein [Helicobacter pylori]GHS47298.1 putative dihydroorotase-like protein [Helicobacter pylori]
MLLKNASFYDGEVLKRADIRLKDSLIAEIKENLSPIKNEEVIECVDLFVLPSFIDLSVTGLEGYENLKQKAFKGGVGLLNVFNCDQSGIKNIMAVKNNQLADIATLKNKGGEILIAQSDAFLELISHYAKSYNLPLLISLENSFEALNSGALAYELGQNFVENAFENTHLVRFMEVSRVLQIPMLLDKVSSIATLKLIKAFNNLGAHLQAQTPLSHLILDESVYEDYEPRFKIAPPLRDKESQNVLKEALKNDEIAMLTSLHVFKNSNAELFEESAFGCESIEDTFSVAYTFLVQKKVISFPQLIKVMATNQARFLKLNAGEVKENQLANLMIVDLNAQTRVINKNSPFYGLELYGEVQRMILKGQTTLIKESACKKS